MNTVLNPQEKQILLTHVGCGGTYQFTMLDFNMPDTFSTQDMNEITSLGSYTFHSSLSLELPINC